MLQTFKYNQAELMRREARVILHNPPKSPEGNNPKELNAYLQKVQPYLQELQTDGVCAALACRYLKAKMTSRPAELALPRAGAYDLIWENDLQAVVIQGKRTRLNSLGPIAQYFGLSGTPVRDGRTPLSDLHTLLSELQPGTGLLFSFLVPAGGHACAAYHSRGVRALGLVGTHLYLFDPNYGEYKGAASELANQLAGKYRGATLNEKLKVSR
jgi:hypothetical protein